MYILYMCIYMIIVIVIIIIISIIIIFIIIYNNNNTNNYIYVYMYIYIYIHTCMTKDDVGVKDFLFPTLGGEPQIQRSCQSWLEPQ